MNLFFDLDRDLLTSAIRGGAVTRIDFKTLDYRPIRLQCYRGRQARLLAGGSLTIELVVKATRSSPVMLAKADLWAASGVTYTSQLLLNSAELIAALGAADRVDLVGELRVTDITGSWRSQTFIVGMHRAVLNGDEGTPLPLADPESWLDLRAVRYDKPMALDPGEQAQARSNIGLGTSATLDWSAGGNGAADDGKSAVYSDGGILRAYILESELIGVKKSPTIRGIIGSGLLSETRTYALPETANFSNILAVRDGELGAATASSVYATGQLRSNTGGQVALMGGLPGQLGVYAGLWFGTTSPSDLNYTILAGAGSTLINGSSGIDFRIGNSTKGFLNSSGTFTLSGGVIATTATFSGNVTAPAVIVDAVISTSSRAVSVTASRNIATSDNGKRLVASGTSAVTVTQISGLTSGHSYTLTNSLTGPAVLTLNPASTTLNGSTRPVVVPHGATVEVFYTGSNAYVTRMSAAVSPRAGHRDATDPNNWELYQDRYAEDYCNNPFVYTTGGIKLVPGPFGWWLAAGDAYTGGGITMFTAASLNATSEMLAQIAGGTFDRASNVISFDVGINHVQTEVMLGWSDQFGTGGDYCAFGIQNPTAGLPATFKFFRGLAGVQTVADSGIAYPTSMANYRLRVILTFDQVTASLRADVWKIPMAVQFATTPAPIFLGTARMGPSEAAPRNLTIQVFNDRPFMRLKTLDTTSRVLSVNKTALKGTTFY